MENGNEKLQIKNEILKQAARTWAGPNRHVASSPSVIHGPAPAGDSPGRNVFLSLVASMGNILQLRGRFMRRAVRNTDDFIIRYSKLPLRFHGYKYSSGPTSVM